MKCSKLCILSFLAVVGLTKAGQSQPYEGHVNQPQVQYVIDRFSSHFPSQGIDGVTEDITKCYEDTDGTYSSDNKIFLQQCILYDISAKELDNAMRHVFLSKSGKDPGPATPFLDDDTVVKRIMSYSQIPFGDESFPEIMAYYGDAPSDVLTALAGGK